MGVSSQPSRGASGWVREWVALPALYHGCVTTRARLPCHALQAAGSEGRDEGARRGPQGRMGHAGGGGVPCMGGRSGATCTGQNPALGVRESAPAVLQLLLMPSLPRSRPRLFAILLSLPDETRRRRMRNAETRRERKAPSGCVDQRERCTRPRLCVTMNSYKKVKLRSNFLPNFSGPR